MKHVQNGKLYILDMNEKLMEHVQSCSNMFKMVNIFTVQNHQGIQKSALCPAIHSESLQLDEPKIWLLVKLFAKTQTRMAHGSLLNMDDLLYPATCFFRSFVYEYCVYYVYIYIYSLYVPFVVIKKGSVKVLIQVLSPVEQFIFRHLCRC